MKTHKYQLVIEFESEKPIMKHSNALVQFENGLGYFVETLFDGKNPSSINDSFVYGTGKTALKKLTPTKRSTARKP